VPFDRGEDAAVVSAASTAVVGATVAAVVAAAAAVAGDAAVALASCLGDSYSSGRSQLVAFVTRW